MADNKSTCFVIMPISTPQEKIEIYQNDELHFIHTLEHLFIPAIKEAGFDPISPKSTGSNIIQADIINNISTCELVLCDMSILNPNVFFEFGIRTALDKPVALVVDDVTSKIPFDTSIINFYEYNHRLDPWILRNEISNLTSHILDAYQKSGKRNSLWKYFGVSQTGAYSPEEAELGEKFDYLYKEISSLKDLLIADKQSKLIFRRESIINRVIGIDRAIKSLTQNGEDKDKERELRDERDHLSRLIRDIEKELGIQHWIEK